MSKGASVPDQALAVPAKPASGPDPSGFDPGEAIPFSVRHNIMDAIRDPSSALPRIRADGFLEHEAHWQARAAIEIMMREAVRSPLFARAILARIEAGTGETTQLARCEAREPDKLQRKAP